MCDTNKHSNSTKLSNSNPNLSRQLLRVSRRHIRSCRRHDGPGHSLLVRVHIPSDDGNTEVDDRERRCVATSFAWIRSPRLRCRYGDWCCCDYGSSSGWSWCNYDSGSGRSGSCGPWCSLSRSGRPGCCLSRSRSCWYGCCGSGCGSCGCRWDSAAP